MTSRCSFIPKYIGSYDPEVEYVHFTEEGIKRPYDVRRLVYPVLLEDVRSRRDGGEEGNRGEQGNNKRPRSTTTTTATQSGGEADVNL